MRNHKITNCEIPSETKIDSEMIDKSWFKDSWPIPISNPNITPIDIYFAVIAKSPLWAKKLIIARNKIAALFDLEVPSDEEILLPKVKESYRVGDKIGPWHIFYVDENEIIAGRDNTHLDFRVSILQTGETAYISTICKTNNWYGKLYLFFIIPFHHFGLKMLVENAMSEKRV